MTSLVIMVIMIVDYGEIQRTLESFVRPTAELKQAQKRERILNAATNLFVTHGYRKTSVDEVASAAGVAKGTVYLYYNNKAALLFHAIALEKLHYLSAFKPLFDPSMSALDRLHGFISLAITWSHKLPLLAKFSSGDHKLELELVLLEVDSRLLEQVNEMQVSFLTHLIDAATGQALTPEALHQRAAALLDLMFAVVTSGRMIQKGMTLDTYAQLMADVLVQGIIHRPREAMALDLLDQRN
jgi:AcrR family transcriptional regulator